MIRSRPLVVWAAVAVWAHTAAAKPRVALTPIDGDPSGDVRQAVAEAIEGKELSVISSKEVNRAMTQLGAPAELTERELRKLSIDLEADAVVAGVLGKAGGGKTLKFRLYVHKKLIKGFTVNFKDPRSEKFRAALHDKFIDKLAAAPADGPVKKPAVADAKSDDAELSDARPDESDVEADAAPRKAAKQVAAADAGAQVDSPAPPRAEPAARPSQPIARVELGASLVQRSYSFSSSDVTGKPIDTSEAAPGVAFDAEMYPVAYMGRTGSLANLGIAIDYGRSFGATVPTVGTATAQVVQSRYEVGLRYRWVIGASPAPPTLTFGLGFGKRLFSPDRSGIADPAVLDALGRNAPNTNYEIVDPGATLRWPVSPRIALSLGASGLVVLDSGGIQSASSYGGGRVFGAELVAGAEVMLGRRFVVRVAADFVQIGFAFDGTGARSNGLDGNAATEEVSGLTDRAIGGSATLGVVY